jgi:hypothetical protein
MPTGDQIDRSIQCEAQRQRAVGKVLQEIANAGRVQVLTDVANELRDKGVLDEDATFAMAKGGGAEIGPTKRGKGMKIMAIVDRHGLPLSVSTHFAGCRRTHSRRSTGLTGTCVLAGPCYYCSATPTQPCRVAESGKQGLHRRNANRCCRF